MHNINNSEGRSLLASLRALQPDRPVRFSEALTIAEIQAQVLLKTFAIEEPAVPSEVVSELPRVLVRRVRGLPASVSGSGHWDGVQWVISVNAREPISRQRFTLMHEFKHIVDHPRRTRLSGCSADEEQRRLEQISDYFAGCVLMPKTMVKRAWTSGSQTPETLARLFGVSPRAAEVRLAQIGLSYDRRCTWPADRTHGLHRRRPGTYFRLFQPVLEAA